MKLETLEKLVKRAKENDRFVLIHAIDCHRSRFITGSVNELEEKTTCLSDAVLRVVLTPYIAFQTSQGFLYGGRPGDKDIEIELQNRPVSLSTCYQFTTNYEVHERQTGVIVARVQVIPFRANRHSKNYNEYLRLARELSANHLQQVS